MKLAIVSVLFVAAVLAAGCKDDHAHKTGDGHDQPTGSGTGAKPEGHGALIKLGTVQLGDLAVEVAQEGKLEAGKGLGLDLTFPKGKPMPTTVRAWVGIEAATGSLKAKLGKEGEAGMHEHLEVPSPLPAGSKIWIEAETANGVVKASVEPRK